MYCEFLVLCVVILGYTSECSAMQAPGKRNRKRAPQEFKNKVMSVLEGLGHSESRSAKLAQEDFMSLLAAFNAAGIHFA